MRRNIVIKTLQGKENKELREKMQIIFQDSDSSLNPRKTIKSILSEPFIMHGIRGRNI